MKYSNKFDLLSSHRRKISLSTDLIDIFACANLYGVQIPIDIFKNKEGRQCVPMPLDWDVDVEFDQEKKQQRGQLAQPENQPLLDRIKMILDDVEPHSQTKLTPLQRTAILLRIFPNFSFAEIARVMGVTKSTAQKHYNTGLKKIAALCSNSPF